jgi:hypothetical protein
MLVTLHSQGEESTTTTRRLRTPRCVLTRPPVRLIVTRLPLKRREAFEEVLFLSYHPLRLEFGADTVHGAPQIGLSQDKDKLPLLCILDPFLAGNEVLVTPCVPLTACLTTNITYDMHSVVVLILDNTLKVSPFPRHHCSQMPINTHAPPTSQC